MPGQVVHTPVYHGPNYDGNGVIHSTEKARGITLTPHKSGKGFNKVGGNIRKSATIQDSSFTKQNEKIEELQKKLEKSDKQNSDYLLLIKDMEKRLRNLEDNKEDKGVK